MVTLLIEEKKLSQDQIDLKEPQALEFSQNLKLGLPTQQDLGEAARNTMLATLCLGSAFVSPFLAIYEAIQEPNLQNVAMIPASPIAGPIACFAYFKAFRKAFN